MVKFWNFIRNSETDSAELLLYGELCSDEPWHTEDYVAYRQFIQDLKNVEESTIHLRINSPGGEVMAANAIFNQLKECGKTIIAHIDGMCASAATIPLMAADRIIASCNAMILIHDPLVCLVGYYNRAELDEIMEFCDKIKSSIIATYKSRMHDVSEEEFDKLMSEERWLDAHEAQDIGLVDEVAYSDITDIQDKGKYLVVNSVRVKKEYFKQLPVNCQKGVTIKEHMQSVNTEKNKKEGGNRHMDEENEIKSLEDMKNKYPEFCKALAEEAAEQERNRIQNLDKIRNSVPAEMLEEAKYGKEPLDAKDLAFRALVAEKGAGEAFLKNLKNDAAESGADTVPASPESGDAESESSMNKGAGTDANEENADEEKVSNLAKALNNDKRREKK